MVRHGLLLDTHAALWLITGSDRLGAEAREAIRTAPKTYLSAACVWETAIKVRSGKLAAPEDITALGACARLLELPILPWHAADAARVSSQLPHRDPFDAMLVAQATLEDLTLVTMDHHLLSTPLCRTLDASV